jgi:DNA-binding transcriptional ArsR family regulator
MGEGDLIEALKAIAHPLRWRILEVLAETERNVGEIEQVTGITQPGLSQQLGVLRKAGLVGTRKDAKLVFYAIAGQQIAELVGAIAGLAPDIAIKLDAPIGPSASATPGVANFARMF